MEMRHAKDEMTEFRDTLLAWIPYRDYWSDRLNAKGGGGGGSQVEFGAFEWPRPNHTTDVRQLKCYTAECLLLLYIKPPLNSFNIDNNQKCFLSSKSAY